MLLLIKSGKNAMLSVLLTFFFLLSGTINLIACEIDMEVVGEKKDVYKEGDVVIVKVKVVLTHRVCPQAMKDTKFDAKGFEIESATDWKEVSPQVWERKLKLRVKSTKTGKLTVSTIRTCDKEGGFGSITLQGEVKK